MASYSNMNINGINTRLLLCYVQDKHRSGRITLIWLSFFIKTKQYLKIFLGFSKHHKTSKQNLNVLKTQKYLINVALKGLDKSDMEQPACPIDFCVLPTARGKNFWLNCNVALLTLSSDSRTSDVNFTGISLEFRELWAWERGLAFKGGKVECSSIQA